MICSIVMCHVETHFTISSLLHSWGFCVHVCVWQNDSVSAHCVPLFGSNHPSHSVASASFTSSSSMRSISTAANASLPIIIFVSHVQPSHTFERRISHCLCLQSVSCRVDSILAKHTDTQLHYSTRTTWWKTCVCVGGLWARVRCTYSIWWLRDFFLSFIADTINPTNA